MAPQLRLPLIALAVVLAGGASVVMAQQAAPPPEIADKVALCASCHGLDGMPAVEKTPIIWGQHQFYMMLQLRDYQAGRRANEIMQPMAKDLSPDDITALAAYFSKLPWPAYHEQASEAEIARARSLETEGQCPQCHLGGYKGNSDVPHTGNQKADYLAQTLRDFRDGVRKNNPAMADLVKGWSDEDVIAMSHYMAGL
jgi:cytochrome c553